jgi:FMNH2-dependent dimethyl sulfone monooxygenase
MHGDPPERIAPKIADLRRRRDEASELLRRETGEELSPLSFGVAGYTIVRDTPEEAAREVTRITNVLPGSPGYRNYQDWIANTKLEQRVSLEDYSVSNRGLRAGLIGTADQVAEQVGRFAEAGVDLLLLQCSPQLEEMERFAAEVIGADHGVLA